MDSDIELSIHRCRDRGDPVRPCLPNRLDAVAGEFLPDDSTDSERDEASDDEIHDVALAVEKSSYSPHGHEVTSPPSDADQGETIRIVTEAVEQSESGAEAVVPSAQS